MLLYGKYTRIVLVQIHVEIYSTQWYACIYADVMERYIYCSTQWYSGIDGTIKWRCMKMVTCLDISICWIPVKRYKCWWNFRWAINSNNISPFSNFGFSKPPPSWNWLSQWRHVILNSAKHIKSDNESMLHVLLING